MKFNKLFTIAIIGLMVSNCKKDDDPIEIIKDEVTEVPTPENEPPSSPVLEAPNQDEELTSLHPILSWQNSTDPENDNIYYDVFLGPTEGDLTNIISDLEINEYEITTDLEKGTTYYWKVVVTDEKGNSGESELFNFTTEHITVNLITESATFSKRNFSTVTVFKDKMWLIGGKDESETALSDIWSSTDGISWTLETNAAPFGTIAGHSTIIFNNKMWLYSGAGNEYLNDRIWSTEDGLNWVQEENDSFLNTVPFYGQFATTMFVFEDKIWRFAAYWGPLGDLTDERYIWNSSDGKNWTLISENHGFDYKYGMEVIPFKGKLIGIEGKSYVDNTYTKVRESSNVTDWEVLEIDRPFLTGDFSEAQVLNDKLFITAGSGYSSALWFTENGRSWQKAASNIKYPVRHANCSVVFNDKIYIVGGGNFIEKYNDVWVIE